MIYKQPFWQRKKRQLNSALESGQSVGPDWDDFTSGPREFDLKHTWWFSNARESADAAPAATACQFESVCLEVRSMHSTHLQAQMETPTKKTTHSLTGTAPT